MTADPSGDDAHESSDENNARPRGRSTSGSSSLSVASWCGIGVAGLLIVISLLLCWWVCDIAAKRALEADVSFNTVCRWMESGQRLLGAAQSSDQAGLWEGDDRDEESYRLGIVGDDTSAGHSRENV